MKAGCDRVPIPRLTHLLLKDSHVAEVCRTAEGETVLPVAHIGLVQVLGPEHDRILGPDDGTLAYLKFF